jgi:hypothetical protein
MKIGALAAGIAVFVLMLLSGCPKSNNMLDHSKTPGAVLQPGAATSQGEVTQGTPPPDGAKSPPPADNGGSNAGGGGDTGGGDSGGDTGGDDGGE